VNGGNIKAYFNDSATLFVEVTDDGFGSSGGTVYLDDIVVTE
jgi:hypothetical protein